MAAETGFMIDGTLHDVPSLDTLNTDEAQALYDYSGISLQDFVRPEDVSDEEFSELLKPMMRNPGFVRALMHIAYQRANPRQNPSRVKALIGQTNMIVALQRLAETDEAADGLPPASTTELEPSSPTSSVVSNGTSGDDSPTTSGERDDQPASITTPESDTSSTSDREMSAA